MLNPKIENLIKKKSKSKIVCLTAYSKNIAKNIDPYSDLILVGDSLGSVLYEFNTTRLVTLDMMINHSKSVKQGITKSLMVVDMPYQTYRNKSEALKNAKKIAKDTKCDAVKLEGGTKIIPIIKHLIQNNINVMGHIGILPQSVKGKFKVKGKNLREQNQLMKDAKALEQVSERFVCLHLRQGADLKGNKSLGCIQNKAQNKRLVGAKCSMHAH